MNDDCRIKVFRTTISSTGSTAPDVSEWSVGMHVQHSCMVTIGVCKFLAESAPPAPRSRFSLPRTIVFATGRIPRGRGKSPAAVLPDQDVLEEELERLLDESERRLAEARTLDSNAWFAHPVFGTLARDKALRFIEIHNRHHQRIIADILAV